MDSGFIPKAESLLRQAQLLVSDTGQSPTLPQLDGVFTTICDLVLDEQIVQDLWHEPVLAQLNWLFTIKQPSSKVFGQLLQELQFHEQEVRQVNDLFFAVLNRGATIEEVYQAISRVSPTDQSLLARLIVSGLVDKTRETEGAPSDRISSFLEALRDDLGIDLRTKKSVTGCLESLKQREGRGRVNALLIRPGQETALVVPLELALHQGNGQVQCAVPTNMEFDGAIRRAFLALQSSGYLSNSLDVVCCLALTDAEYVGSSMGLATVAGLYGAGSQTFIDPYTAFTGDVVLEQGEWRVKFVNGLSKKIAAARLHGCRRVFIPSVNLSDLQPNECTDLLVTGVGNVLEILFALHRSPEPCREGSVQAKKLNVVRAYCHASGWALSEPRVLQSGVQFRIAPLNAPELSLNIYTSGAHVPKAHEQPDYQTLLTELATLDEPAIPIRRVQKTYTVQDPALRQKLRKSLETLHPQEKRDEQYCEFSFKYERGQERLTVKQFTSGKLQIQGSAGELLKALLECLVPLYKVHYPNASLSVEAELAIGTTPSSAPESTQSLDRTGPAIPLPHIGTDESGKGDYFGPMVVAGVLLDAETQAKLEALGVKDSKLLSDKRCRELAAQIRSTCGKKFEEVEMPPERYNQLYEDFRREGQNLNHLLAWGHARAIESLLERYPCSHAVADQFGDEKYILSRLMQKGKRLDLTQLTKGERYIAVAAASILARDKFLSRMDKMSEDYGIAIPKGASDAVVNAGREMVAKKGAEELRRVAKLHHKTTEKILKVNGETSHG